MAAKRRTPEELDAYNAARRERYAQRARPEGKVRERASAAIPAWARFWVEQHRLACCVRDVGGTRPREVKRRLGAAPEKRRAYYYLRNNGVDAGGALRELGL